MGGSGIEERTMKGRIREPQKGYNGHPLPALSVI